jgi:hypothetical protein
LVLVDTLGIDAEGHQHRRFSLRVETLISIKSIAQQPSQSSASAAVYQVLVIRGLRVSMV